MRHINSIIENKFMHGAKTIYTNIKLIQMI